MSAADLHDLDDVAAEFGIDLTDNKETTMNVRVYDHNGSKQTYDADSIETDGGVLWVTKGRDVVAAYAPTRWINADILPDEAGE